MVSRKSCFCLLMALVFTTVLLVAVGYRVLQPNTATMPLPLPHATGTPLTGTEADSDFHFTYQWNLRDCPSGTEILGDPASQTVDKIKGDAIWRMELTARDGKLTLRTELPEWRSGNPLCKIHTRFCITEKQPVWQRMPSTRRHRRRHFLLACELSVDYGFGLSHQTIYMQELVVDLADGAADLQAPAIPPSLARLPRTRILRGAATGLPERFCGSVVERELLRYLHHLALVEDAGTAAALLPGLKRRGEHLTEYFAEANAPWPECWGTGADTARTLARRVRPLLRHMQEHNCYGSAELLEFVNGPVFSRIFGPPTED